MGREGKYFWEKLELIENERWHIEARSNILSKRSISCLHLSACDAFMRKEEYQFLIYKL